jgi:hypothetical protein
MYSKITTKTPPPRREIKIRGTDVTVTFNSSGESSPIPNETISDAVKTYCKVNRWEIKPLDVSSDSSAQEAINQAAEIKSLKLQLAKLQGEPSVSVAATAIPKVEDLATVLSEFSERLRVIEDHLSLTQQSDKKAAAKAKADEEKARANAEKAAAKAREDEAKAAAKAKADEEAQLAAAQASAQQADLSNIQQEAAQ